MTADIATRGNDAVTAGGGGALAITPDQTTFSTQQKAALGHIGLGKTPEGDVLAFLHLCQRTGLDPWSRQIYLIERGGKWTPQTAIDGFRVIAERRSVYRGQTSPQWCGPDGVWRDVWLEKEPPTAARVGVLRSDRDEPAYEVCLFAEFDVGNAMWKQKPAHMIKKVAESAALRKAFPQDVAGLVTDDEAAAAERALRTSRVSSQRVEHAPVDVGELTGTKTAPADPAAAQVSAATDDRMSQPQQKRLFALIRDAGGVGDRNSWANQVLGRDDITSFGQLSQRDAAALMDNLEGLIQAAREDAAVESAGADASGQAVTS